MTGRATAGRAATMRLPLASSPRLPVALVGPGVGPACRPRSRVPMQATPSRRGAVTSQRRCSK
eukprot:14338901-Alexandrium_andersonii.AAC.1